MPHWSGRHRLGEAGTRPETPVMSTAAGRRLVDAVLRRSPAAGLSDCEIRGGPLDRQPGWDCRTPDRAVRVGERLVGRPGHPPGRVGFGSGQKKPGVFSSGPCPTRPGGRAVKLSPHPTRQPVGSGRVRVGSGRAYVKCRVPSGFSGFGSKFLARARPVSHTGSKILTRARPSNSSGRVGSGYFRAGWVGSVGSGSPCPGLKESRRRRETKRISTHIMYGGRVILRSSNSQLIKVP